MLTDEGKLLVQLVDGPLQSISEAVERLVNQTASVSGAIRIGGPRAFSRHWLAKRLPKLLAKHPRLTPVVTFDVASAIEHKLASGTIDLALMPRPTETAGLSSQRLATETFVAVGPFQRRFALQQLKTASDFRSQRWIIFDRDMAMHRQWWMASFGKTEAMPTQIACEIAGLDEMLLCVEEGIGLAILPQYLVQSAIDSRRVVALAPPNQAKRPAKNTLFLAWRTATPLTKRFEVVRDALLDGAM